MRRLPSLAVALALGSCGNFVDLPPAADPLPLLEGFLEAGTASQLFRIVWADSATGPVSARPVPADRVSLVLAARSGGRAALVPVADSPGYHRASLPAVPGAGYRLEGDVAGRSIRAETEVPSRFDVVDPPGDTLAGGPALTIVRYRWSATGAAAFLARGARFVGTLGPFTRDSAGELALGPPPGPPTTGLTLYALSPEAAEYLLEPISPRSNVRGGFGYLGAGIAIRKTVRWP